MDVLIKVTNLVVVSRKIENSYNAKNGKIP